MPPVRAFLIAALVAAAPVRAAVLRESTGLVQVRAAGADSWRPAGKTPRPISEGDGVRTGFNARAVVALDGGTLVAASGNAHFSLEADGRGHSSVAALFGTLELRATLLGGRTAQVRTPTCLVRARGDRVAARVTVAAGGGTTVEAVDGSVGVEDNRGGSLLLRKGQRVEVDLGGVHEPSKVPTPVQARRTDFLSLMRRELAFEAGREADFAAASRESRREERELGRVLTDSDGARVRVETYVVRPSADRVNLVTVNGRADGLSYASWDGTFDRALPRDLSSVFGSLAGSAAATPWTLTTLTTTRSNGRDSLVERAAGGHQVDVNANADPLDDAVVVFDAARDSFVASPTAFKTIFDRYGLYADGVLKRGFTGVALQTYADATASSTNDPITGAALTSALPIVVTNVSLPDAGAARRQTLESYGDGTSVTVDDLSVASFGGGTAPLSAFGGNSSGAGFARALLGWNYEQKLSVSGFSSPIRIVMPARDLVVTGRLP